MMGLSQESIDLKKFFRYKKEKPPLNGRSLLMGFSGGFEQGKPATALPELINFISIKIKRVNP